MFKFFGSKKDKSTNISEVTTEKEVMQPSVNVSSNKGGELSDKMPDKKLVAVISAAIAASRGESDCAFNVISINKIS